MSYELTDLLQASGSRRKRACMLATKKQSMDTRKPFAVFWVVIGYLMEEEEVSGGSRSHWRRRMESEGVGDVVSVDSVRSVLTRLIISLVLDFGSITVTITVVSSPQTAPG
ncbi:hypothetical protein EVAR_13535_1 [Eumeta japonica]|uniref:Uncharacterized protein n=1 Tax=Eumeta variegata TaxID=151549 RepID=A0A4C1U8N5_EUMVA|nr:hypothetical protein EVAR_13535_1 [Eumeta japonica]